VRRPTIRRSGFSEERMIGHLKEHQTGLPVAELCRKRAIGDATFSTWRWKDGGIEVSDAKRLQASRRRTGSSRGCWPSTRWTRRPRARCLERTFYATLKKEAVICAIESAYLP
jgi:hypothetical protein